MHYFSFRRCFCLSLSTSSVPIRSSGKKKLVFLGSPLVSVTVLDALLDASSEPQSQFEVAAVVTQPPSARYRGRKVMPSPIGMHALNRGIHPDVIFTPERSSDAPDLLALLFDRGSKLLLKEMPSILDGSAWTKAQPQNDSKATLAPKISPDESWLSFKEEAVAIHNKVRAFAGWPGTWARLEIVDSNGEHGILELKIITTRVCGSKNVGGCEDDDVMFDNGRMIFPCGSGTSLQVLEVQIPGKKVVGATAFWNGIRGRRVKRLL